jgi:hypothetical protein
MKQLLNVLQSIEKPGAFCASASIIPCFLGLEVKNIGAIALSLQPKQAKN